MANCLYSGDKPLGVVQSNAEDIEYSTGVSVKDELDEVKAKIQRIQKTSTPTLSFSNIPSTCTGFLQTRAFNGGSESQWVLTPFNIYQGTVAIDTPLIVGNDSKYPVSVTYSNGTLTFTMAVANGSYFATLYYGA